MQPLAIYQPLPSQPDHPSLPLHTLSMPVSDLAISAGVDYTIVLQPSSEVAILGEVFVSG
jgi:hypothetical protein